MPPRGLCLFLVLFTETPGLDHIRTGAPLEVRARLEGQLGSFQAWPSAPRLIASALTKSFPANLRLTLSISTSLEIG